MSAATSGDGKSQDVPITWIEEKETLGGKAMGAGHAAWRRIDGMIRGLAFGCPCGCGESWLPVVKGPSPPGDHKHGPWGWNGDEAKPTLEPSILSTGCGWHGYLKGGVFVPTSDRRG